MTEQRPELLSCPFCGGEANYRPPHDNSALARCVISCDNADCPVYVEVRLTPEAAAVKAWNARSHQLNLIDAHLALLNWQKYNTDKADEIVYQAEKMATAIEKLIEAASRRTNPTDALVEEIAHTLCPEWFGETDGRHVLDNFPGQHIQYQERARKQAIALLPLIKRVSDEGIVISFPPEGSEHG